MYYKFIRYIFAFIVILSFAHVAAQPCADTQPLISGAQSVTNSQSNVIYSTPNIPGHTYSWSVNGGTITSGMNTNQISVLWGPVGAGSVSVTEVNPALNCSTTVSRTIQVRPLLVAYLYYTNESCYGNTLSFFGDKCIADAQKPIVSYEWDFGDLGTSTLQNPTHTYNPPWNQTWTIRLIVTNSEGYKDTIYDAVYVNPDQYIPHPDFIASIPSCGYDAVQFDATPPISNTPPGTEPIWKYVWDFGDPSSPSNHDSTASPLTSHLFTTPGTYTVKLRIGNYKSCQGEITRTVTVLPSIPDASYAYSTPTCINNPTFFTDQSLPALNHNITKWEWNFGDGSTPVVVNSPATPNISHVYPGLGPYNTWLKVTNEIGCSDSIYRSISLTPSPIAGFKNLSNCVGDTVHFQSTSLTNNGPLIDSYYWDFGDPGSGFNISTNQNPIHLYGASGFYTVTLIIQNEAGCPDTLTKVIQIFDPPAVEYTYILGPQNNTVSFHLDQFITPVGRIGNMVQWNFGDGTFGYGYDPIHVYPAGGTFNVTLSVVDTNGCSNEVTHQIYVPALPMAFFSTNSPVCAGQPLCVTDLSNAATPPFGWITKWIWNWGDGSPDDTINFPNDPNLCHMYSLADTFSVTLTVFDNFGFSDSYTRDIIIMPNPIANFFFTGSCEDQVISFTDASFANGGGNIISYDWNFGDPLSGLNNQSNLQNPIHIFANGGVYQVRLIIENFQGCVDTIIKDVPVRFGPSIEFSYDTACLEQVTTFNACTGITQCDSIAVWSWNFGDGTPLVTDPVATSHLYIAPGTYTVTLTITDIHGCISTKTHTVIVNPLPIPAFSWSTPTCQDVAVTFTDESLVPAGYTGYIAKWQWDFGDGTPVQTITLPGSPNIVHLFPTTAISFNVKLTVWTSDSCTKFIEHTITLTPAPLANFGFSSVNCSSQAVNFTDLSQTNGGGSVTEWAWNFGDPGSGVNNFSSNQNPSHTYITSGPYTVTLIVKNVTGCSDTIQKTIDISAPPFSSFVADTACVNSPTTFTYNFPVTGVSSFLWNFGDGNISTVPNPVHTYSTYGIYPVTLHIVSTTGCIDDTTRMVLVNPKPIAAFSYTSPNCLGASVSFTDLSSTVTGYLGHIQTWEWHFGDGSGPVIINFPNPPNTTHVFAGSAQNHTVTLIVTTNDGCIDSVQHIITSIPAPIANFSFPPNTCEDLGIQFTDLSQQNGGGNIVTWNWNFGDPTSGGNNNSTAQNPIHFFNTPGAYTVTLIVSNASGCKDTVIINNINVLIKPVANFVADTACLGSTTTFTSSTTGVNQWLWDFGDGGSATNQNPTHTYLSAGVFPVHLTVTTAQGCPHDTTKNVLVIGKPVAAFSTSAPACASDSVAFTNLSTTPHGIINQWVWDFGDGSPTVTRTGAQNPNVKHKYTNGGNYTVTLTITTSDNCTDTKQNSININFAPVANFDFAVTRCEMMPVQFTDLSQTNGGSAIAQWNWTFGDPASGSSNTSTLQNPMHSFTAGGTSYWVRLIITNAAGCISKDSTQVSVNDAPVAIFAADTACIGSNTQFTDASTTPSGTITAWSWEFGEPSSGTNNFSTLQNPTHSYAAPGSYNVILTVTNSNSCTKDTVVVVDVYPKPSALFEYTPSCINSETQFTDLSIAPGSMITSWFWDFGDGTGTSTDQNPTYIYTTGGTYQVKLIVTNLSNCQDSVTMAVTARPTPAAAFAYTSFYCPAGQVNFQDQSTGAGSAIVERYWIFEPGYTSNLPNPVHTFTTPGQDYPVTLIVTDNYGCKDTIVDTVAVKAGFAFNFTTDTVCFNSPTHFTPVNQTPGDSLFSVYWDFGDPNSGPNNFSFLYSPQHTYTTPGYKVVKLKAYNSDNCVDSVFRTIRVYALPEPSYAFTSLPCDSIIRFQDGSTAGNGTIASWEWTFGDGSPSVVIPAPGPGDTSHQYTIGTYPVTLKVTNIYGCIETLTDTVELYPCIMADFTHGDTLLCSRYPITFSDSSLPADRINTWHWNFGDGNDTTYTSRTGTIVHTFDNPGVYLVRLSISATVSGIAFRDSLFQMVTVHPTPTPGFMNSSVCLNQITLFTDTTINYGAPVTTWNWNFGHPASGINNNSVLQSPTHKFDTAGLYPVQLVVMNQFGCKDSVIENTRVFSLPGAGFSSTVACSSNPTNFTDMTSLGDTAINMWHWNFGVPDTKHDTSLVQNPVYQYDTSGDYTVRLIVRDRNGCLDTVDSVVTVYNSPLSAFNITDNVGGMTGKVQLNNFTLGADVYYWDFGNGKHSTDENPIVTYENDGTYEIMLISSNQHECSDTTFYQYKVLFKGLYIPNAFAPTSTNYAVMLFKPMGVNLKTYLIEVYDNWGHQLWTSDKLDIDGHPTEGWDGTDSNGNLMPQGTYMWRVNASFIDGSEWQGSEIGRGEYKTMGTVTLIR